MRWLGVVLIICALLVYGCATIGEGSNTKVGGEVVLRGTCRDM